MKITFLPLIESHFPLLLKWLEAEHVKEWWDQDVVWTQEKIQKKYSTYVKGFKRLELASGVIEKPMHAYIICIKGNEIGYIQYYNAYDFPREQGFVLDATFPKSMASIDVFIGELSYTGKGMGPAAISAFVDEHLSNKFAAVFVDPDLSNISAIKAYEKCGFKIQKTLEDFQIVWMIRPTKTAHKE
jgi:aminoglycoside 6'-N-acetyltransferase